MSVVIPVSADWLTLREPVDARSRSPRLRGAAASAPGSPPVIHDLGSGTGAMMRWMAPVLDGPQRWVLHDWNPDLVGQATAAAHGGSLTVRTSVEDLAALTADHLAGATLVTASALLDVLTRAEIDAVVRACLSIRAPALLTLSVTGRVALDPVDPADRLLEAAFNAHQRRATGGRRLAGPDAVDVTAARFREAGWTVRTAASPWRLDAATDAALLTAWLDGWISAAVEQRPELGRTAMAVHVRRRDEIAAGRLRATVHHRDILARPS